MLVLYHMTYIYIYITWSKYKYTHTHIYSYIIIYVYLYIHIYIYIAIISYGYNMGFKGSKLMSPNQNPKPHDWLQKFKTYFFTKMKNYPPNNGWFQAILMLFLTTGPSRHVTEKHNTKPSVCCSSRRIKASSTWHLSWCSSWKMVIQWIGWRENLNRKPWFNSHQI